MCNDAPVEREDYAMQVEWVEEMVCVSLPSAIKQICSVMLSLRFDNANIRSVSASPLTMVYDAHMSMSRYLWLIVRCVHEIEALGVTKAFHKHWQ